MLWATNATKYHQGFRERPLQAMESYLRGRVRNLNLSPKRCNLPVFEAVMNSLQAIEDRTSSGWKPSDARIRIAVVRDESQGTLFDGGSVPTIKDVVIEDNGVGFDDEHFAAFCRLDDDFRAAKGGKGIGRLSWLSAFQRVSVSSVFENGEGARCRRTFEYAVEADGTRDEKLGPAGENDVVGTVVTLSSLQKKFRDEWPKKPSTFVDRLAVHFQRFLALDTCPQIDVVDGLLHETIELRQYFRENFLVDRHESKFKITGKTFNVVHLLHRVSGEPGEQRHTITMLANGRPAEDPHTIPAGLGVPKGGIRCDGTSLYYSAFVSGEVLDELTNDSRTYIDIATEDTALPNELTREQIVEKTAAAGRKFLGDRVAAMYADLQERIQRICYREVRYRPLLKHCAAQLNKIEPSLPDSKLEDAINAVYRDYMESLRARTRRVSKRASQHIDDLDAFRDEIKEVLENWNEAAMSDLASYVAHRRVILWFLKERLRLKDSGKFHFEESVHAVFFPMGFDTDGYPVSAANLWLIDERMSFHEYLASDMAISRHTTLKNESAQEPDVTVYDAAHAFGPNEPQRATITLVEFKRPGREGYTMEDNPYTQAVRYVEDIRDGTARFRDGRPISDLRNVHFFVYLIADRSKPLHRILKAYDFLETSDGRGYFKHSDCAYFEVITYEKLIDDAAMRHKAFFDRLHLPEDAGGGVADE